MKIVASSPISWDREKSGGKSDRLRSSLVDHLPFDFDSRRRDSRSDGGWIRHRPTDRNNGRGVRWNVQLRMTGDSFSLFFFCVFSKRPAAFDSRWSDERFVSIRFDCFLSYSNVCNFSPVF